MRSLESGTADGFGMAYNAAVWSECHRFAAQFLSEAKERIGGEVAPLFDRAAGYYETVAQCLTKVCDLFPFPPKGEGVKDAERCAAAIGHLKVAREAEESGLGALETIEAAL